MGEQAVPPTRTVVIPACDEHYGIYAIAVTLIWICPTCGEPRGEPGKVRSYDGSLWMVVDGWTNPCGHVDKYHAVRAEVQAMNS